MSRQSLTSEMFLPRFRLLVGLFGILCLAPSISTAEESAEVVELGVKNFTSTLQDTKFREGHLLIEFYAHWCPHCTHYRPEYEKIGAYFLTEPRPKPLIWVLRIDCAIKENAPVCDKYQVHGYPTIYLGRVESFLLKETTQLTRANPMRLEEMKKFISTTLNMELDQTKDPKKEEVDESRHQEVAKIELVRKETKTQMSVADIERATVEMFDHLLQSEVILQGAKVREAFIQFLALLQEAHPSKRCRSSIRYLHNHLNELWPQTESRPQSILSKFKICGVDYTVNEWTDCAGTKPNLRGFTCGVWQLLHALTVGIDPQRVHVWITGIEAFGNHFFGCEECAKHFLKTMQELKVHEVHKKADLVLWLWEVHNRVNLRLQKEEAENNDGDPDFPKIEWPSRTLCPKCRNEDSKKQDWNREAVLSFLLEFYAPVMDKGLRTVSRKELPDGDLELKAIDVFPREYANITRSGGVHFRIYLFFMVAIVIGYTLRKKRARNNRHRKKELP